jgi:hypothetical protein
LLAEIPRRRDPERVKRFGLGVAVVFAIVLVAGVCWVAIKKHNCNSRGVAFTGRVEGIEKDAHEHLKIGTDSAGVARFFERREIPSTIVGSTAYGTWYSFGCAPLGCGTDRAVVGVSVKLDNSGAVTEAPKVVGGYVDCSKPRTPQNGPMSSKA